MHARSVLLDKVYQQINVLRCLSLKYKIALRGFIRIDKIYSKQNINIDCAILYDMRTNFTVYSDMFIEFAFPYPLLIVKLPQSLMSNNFSRDSQLVCLESFGAWIETSSAFHTIEYLSYTAFNHLTKNITMEQNYCSSVNSTII